MGETPTPLAILGQLQEAFASSDLPWRVDAFDWASTSPEFQKHIEPSSVALKTQTWFVGAQGSSVVVVPFLIPHTQDRPHALSSRP